jgi:hypothetical protein
MVFNATFQQFFSYIVAVSFVGGKTLSHNVVPITPRHERGSKSRR